MANRVFQGVVCQMKDAIGRNVGVLDETGNVVSCSDLNQVGEIREGIAGESLTGSAHLLREGKTNQPITGAKHND